MVRDAGGGDQLTILQARGALSLISDWYLGLRVKEWEGADESLFLSRKLSSIARLANQGVSRENLWLALQRDGHWPDREALDLEMTLVPTTGAYAGLSFADRVEQLRRIADERRMRRELQEALADMPSAGLQGTLQKVAGIKRQVGKSRFRLAAHDVLWGPLGPINWVCEGMHVAPGPPSMWAGYGFSGKTMAAQLLALCVASGLDYHGMRVRQGKVLHLDYEQGTRLTASRYQRLGADLGIGRPQVQDNLSVAILPTLSLDAKEAESELRGAVEGHALCIVDSYRAACPSTDESSSEARAPLDMLNRVSEATACAFLVIHHGRKPGGDSSGGARMAMRGSSGIYDAAGSVVIFGGEKGEPVTVQHEKAKLTGDTFGDRHMTIDDGPDGELVVRMTDKPEEEAGAGTAGARLGPSILAFVAEHPGCSLRGIRGGVNGRFHEVGSATALLLETGKLVNIGSDKNHSYHVAEKD